MTPSASASAWPVTAVSGVRSSWEIDSRNSRWRPSLRLSAPERALSASATSATSAGPSGFTATSRRPPASARAAEAACCSGRASHRASRAPASAAPSRPMPSAISSRLRSGCASTFAWPAFCRSTMPAASAAGQRRRRSLVRRQWAALDELLRAVDSCDGADVDRRSRAARPARRAAARRRCRTPGRWNRRARARSAAGAGRFGVGRSARRCSWADPRRSPAR